MNDLRFAIRMLLKNPAFTVVAALSLAVGIGANTVVFCWIQESLLRPLPGVAQGGQMVVLCTTHGSEQWETLSLPDLRDYARLTNVFSGIVGSQITPACLTVNGKPEWVYGQITTANFFDVLGVKALLGRTFVAEEDLRPGGAPVLVLSEGYWRRRFGSDPNVIGRVVDLNRHSFTIVGVAPGAFRGTMSGLRFDFWAPLVMHEQVANFGSLNNRGDHWLHTQARLRPGVSRAQAQAAVDTTARQLEQAYPADNREIGLRVLPMWKSPSGGQAYLLPVLSILFAVSLGVLLIVAANVANLLLARATVREKEIAIRLALGAGRARLIRQLLIESLVLACVGGLLGVLAANWGTALFKTFLPRTYLPIGYTFAGGRSHAAVHRGAHAGHRRRVWPGAGVAVVTVEPQRHAQGRRAHLRHRAAASPAPQRAGRGRSLARPDVAGGRRAVPQRLAEGATNRHWLRPAPSPAGGAAGGHARL